MTARLTNYGYFTLFALGKSAYVSKVYAKLKITSYTLSVELQLDMIACICS